MSSDGITPVRLRINTWLEQHHEESNSVRELAGACTAALMADPGFQELLASFVGATAQAAALRKFQDRDGSVQLGDRSVARERMLAEVAQTSPTTTVLEWVEQFEGRTKPVLRMTREELRSAAMEREEKAQGDLQVAWLWRRLANQMRVGETVGDRFSLSQVLREFGPLEGQQGETDFHRYYLNLQKHTEQLAAPREGAA